MPIGNDSSWPRARVNKLTPHCKLAKRRILSFSLCGGSTCLPEKWVDNRCDTCVCNASVLFCRITSTIGCDHDTKNVGVHTPAHAPRTSFVSTFLLNRDLLFTCIGILGIRHLLRDGPFSTFDLFSSRMYLIPRKGDVEHDVIEINFRSSVLTPRILGAIIPLEACLPH